MAIAVSQRFAPSGDLPVEAGRYRLVAAGSCPWCRRVLIARRLLGLTEAIPVSWTYGKGADGYWELTGPEGEPGVDPALGARSLAEVYERTPGYEPPPTVPALVDMTTGEVVSDDSGDMLFDLSTAWWDLHRPGARTSTRSTAVTPPTPGTSGSAPRSTSATRWPPIPRTGRRLRRPPTACSWASTSSTPSCRATRMEASREDA